MESDEFQNELLKTKKFTDKVVESRGWHYNTNEEINEGIIMGLSRNKILYGKRFCPCFMVEENSEKPGKFKSVDDRICPCKPAIEKEIPEDGICHCQIFCTEDYLKNKS